MGTIGGAGPVQSAMSMAGHPRFAQWRERSLGYLQGSLQPLLATDGAGISCPSYLGASMGPILEIALALKFGGQYDAFADDPCLKRFGQFMADLLTPVDPRVGRRGMWPLGHTARRASSTRG